MCGNPASPAHGGAVGRHCIVALSLATLGLLSCGAPGRDAGDLEAAVERILPRVQALSGLPALEPVRVGLRSQAELQEYIARKIEEELPPAKLAGIEAAYNAFGLLPDTLDLRGLLLDLYSEQALGYYDPDTGTLFLVEGSDPATLEPVLAHELVHALQDQHVDLAALVHTDLANDRRLAAHAAIEGHATLVMLAFMLERQTGQPTDVLALPPLEPQLAEMVQARYQEFPVFLGAPRLIRETLLFPYVNGTGFVQRLWTARQAQPPPFDSLLPLSTAAVVDAQTHLLERSATPPRIRFQALADIAGPGQQLWRILHEDDLGEFEIAVLLSKHLARPAGNIPGGWAADRFRLVDSPEHGKALTWLTLWRSDSAADVFAAAYREVLARRPGRHGIVERAELLGLPGVWVVDAELSVPLALVPRPAVISSRMPSQEPGDYSATPSQVAR